jgi:Uma2 family endonuclease
MSASVQLISKKTNILSEKTHSLEEYLAMEVRSRAKHEFFNGQIVLMAGRKYAHNLIAMNTGGELRYLVRSLPQEFMVLNSDQKIYIPAVNDAVYPDAVVICEVPEFWNGREDLLVNPILVVEVLSKSTAKYDRTGKFLLYNQIPSFREYVLIEQKKAHIESWFRLTADSNTWDKTTQTDLNGTLALRSLGVSLALSEVYRQVKF